MSRTIGIVLALKDAFSPQIKKVAEKLNITEEQAKKLDRALAKTSKNMKKSFDKMAKASFVAAGAFAAISVKAAADFEQGMNNVATLIDTDVESLDDMTRGVLELAKDSPKAIGDLTDSLYNIRSAGISASDQFKVLKGSEMLAVAGLASTAEAVDIATSAINAFNLKGEEADGVYDMFFKAVKFGKTNVAEFAQGFGAVAGVVASANIDLKEYTAGVAAMTTTGVKASVAHTQLKAVIAGLSRNSKEQNKVFQQLGAKSFKDLIEKSGGMVNALQRVKNAVGGDEAKIISLTGSVEAYNAVMSLTGANNEKFKEALDEMANGSDALTQAYQKQMDGFNNQVSKLKNSLQSVAIQAGDALIPTLKLVGRGLEWVTENMDLVIPAAAGVLSMFAAYKTITVFNNAMTVMSNVLKVNTGVWKALNFVIAQNPIIRIAVIIGIVVGALVLAYKKFEGFRNCVQALWSCIKLLGSVFVALGKILWSKIGGFVKWGAIIIGLLTPMGQLIALITLLWKGIQKLANHFGGFRKIGEAIKGWADNKKEVMDEVNADLDKEKPKKHALGTTYSTGGAAIVGEYGPELINLKRGDSVTPAGKTRQIMTNKPVTINVNIAGNVIGNNEFIQNIKNVLALELKTALAAV